MHPQRSGNETTSTNACDYHMYITKYKFPVYNCSCGDNVMCIHCSNSPLGTLRECCDLSQLWFREFYLELTMGERIQVRGHLCVAGANLNKAHAGEK